jgi:hypothetical protein
MPRTLVSIIKAVRSDPGLKATISDNQIDRGIRAADRMNDVLLRMIDKTNVNNDGQITASDMVKISKATFNSPAAWQDFLLGHGNDAGRTTGFHWVQNDGGTLESITSASRSRTAAITTKTAMTMKPRWMWRAG